MNVLFTTSESLKSQFRLNINFQGDLGDIFTCSHKRRFVFICIFIVAFQKAVLICLRYEESVRLKLHQFKY